MRLFVSFIIFFSLGIQIMSAQARVSDQPAPIYRLTVVQHALQAVNFQGHSGPPEIDLNGTVLLPRAQGTAIVEVKNGYTKIDLTLKRLLPPTQFGTEFLTYVLWAISPDGRATNLGEVVANGSDKASMHITCPYSTFGLLVTAEPYFFVPYPSEVVVIESSVRHDIPSAEWKRCSPNMRSCRAVSTQ